MFGSFASPIPEVIEAIDLVRCEGALWARKEGAGKGREDEMGG